MKTINLSDFVKILLEDVATKRSACYTISEYGKKNIFTITEKLGDEIYLEIPEDDNNKYDLLFNKITEAFEGKYELVSMVSFDGEYEIDIVIDDVFLIFDYYTKVGRNWVYKMYSQI